MIKRLILIFNPWSYIFKNKKYIYVSLTLFNFILLICSISIYISSCKTEKEYDDIDCSILRDVKNQSNFKGEFYLCLIKVLKLLQESFC